MTSPGESARGKQLGYEGIEVFVEVTVRAVEVGDMGLRNRGLIVGLTSCIRGRQSCPAVLA